MKKILKAPLILSCVLFFFAIGIGAALGASLAATRNIINSEYITEFETALPTKLLDINGEVITEFASDEKREIIAYFALSSKSVSISCDFLSNSLQRKVKRYGIYNPTTNNVQASAYLIAQFGKNAEISSADSISGDALMELVFSVLKEVQHNIGGGIAFLECEDRPKLLDFYKNPHNSFHVYGERLAEDSTRYIQLMHVFSEKTFAN